MSTLRENGGNVLSNTHIIFDKQNSHSAPTRTGETLVTLQW